MQPSKIIAHRGLLNDVNRGLAQQMFFWGRDVMTAGNLLAGHGFERLPSPGSQATSCYRKEWGEGLIELHGHCAGWYPAESCRTPGFIFVRTLGRGHAHHQNIPAAPGCYESYLGGGHLKEQMEAGRHFCRWLAAYEEWILRRMGRGYREECFAMFCKLPGSRAWLPPCQALDWWRCFAANDARLTRARCFAGMMQDAAEKFTPHFRPLIPCPRIQRHP